MAAMTIDWQELISLGVVALAAVMLIRSFIRRSRNHQCDQCVLMEPKRTNAKR